MDKSTGGNPKKFRLSHLIGAFVLGFVVVGAFAFAPGSGLQGFIGQTSSVDEVGGGVCASNCELNYKLDVILNELGVYTKYFGPVSGDYFGMYTGDFDPSTGDMNPYTDDFGPGGLITRGDYMASLARLHFQKNSPDEQPDYGSDDTCFSDTAGTWYGERVCYLNDLGLIGGYADGSFRGGEAVLRAEGAKFAIEVFEAPLFNTTSTFFSDLQQSDWYYTYAWTMVRYGDRSYNAETREWFPGEYLEWSDAIDWANLLFEKVQ